jgi:L-methionine (R)-S-oxide reductase
VSSEAYEQSLRAIEQVIADGSESDEILRRAVDLLHDGFESYSWVGVYFAEATEHVRIPIGEGVCGSAAASGRTEIVDDVNADARYLACFASTRSEIVVPISYDGLVVAEIDIDSDRPAAFGDGDRTFLERVAELLSPYCLVGWDTGGEPWEP